MNFHPRHSRGPLESFLQAWHHSVRFLGNSVVNLPMRLLSDSQPRYVHPLYSGQRQPDDQTEFRPRRRKIWRRYGLASLLLLAAFGCQGLQFARDSNSTARDPFLETTSNDTSINRVKGPMERNLLATSREKSSSSVVDTTGLREFEAAKASYEAGDYAAAERAFKKISDDHALDETGFFRRRNIKNLFLKRSELEANYYDNPLVEDSLFMLAESRYQLKKYPGAEDVYLQLLKQYPNTRHMDATTRRLFDIALNWMQFKGTTSNDVQLAEFSDTGRSARPEVVSNADYKRPSFFNLTDRSRPWSDTEGRALEALKAIWLNDPTGPLADDALMLTASHYLRVGRHAEASETFRLLREEFPNSPHVKDAFVLGSYVTQASYQGASYDDQALLESRQLKTMALNMFPNMTAEEKARIEEEIYRLDDATVARQFEMALFWLKKARFDAVEMYCHHIVNSHPESKYAGKARGLLQMIPELRKRNTLLLAMQGFSADDIPSVDEPDSMPGRTPTESLPGPGVGRSLRDEERPDPASRPSAPVTPQEPDSEPAPRQAPRYLPSLEMPKLKPIPVPRLWPQREDPELESAPPFDGGSGGQPEPGRVQMTLGND